MSARGSSCPECGGAASWQGAEWSCYGECLGYGVVIPPAAWDDPDPDDPPATRDDDPMWGRVFPPAERSTDDA